MLRLTYGQDWGHLVDAWWPSLAEADPFEPVDILVPDEATTRWLRIRVAERRGIASHWRPRSLDAWMRETAPELLTPATLRDRFVESMARGEGPDPVRRWVDAARSDRDLRRRWVQLGGRLAEGLLEAWRDLDEPELAPDVGAWVAAVLEESDGWTLARALEEGAFRRPAQSTLHVLDAIPPLRGPAAAVAQSAEVRQVLVLASNPCVEFWEDLPFSDPRSRQTELAFEGLEENPLLVAWGQHARPLVRALDFASAGDFEACFRSPDAASALHQVQREVLGRRAAEPRTPDESLTISVFGSLEEEARWIASGIRQRIDEGCEPFELGVALAGDDGAFRSALDAALEEVPLHHLDRRVLDRSPVFDAARRLWRLDGGATGAELQDLLLHPKLAAPLDGDQRTLAVEWVRAAGMLEGLDGPRSWTQGLGRLARGLLAGPDEPGGGVSTSEPEAVARFIGFVRRLGRAIPVAGRKADRRSWMNAFHGMATQFITAHDETDERDLGLLLHLVSERCEPGAPVWSHDMVWRLLEERMSRLRRAEGPSAGVAVGRLDALSRRPLRCAWVVQLDDRHFPRRSARRPLGLPGRDLGQEDRFALLLRLMNTRESLGLSWSSGPDGERGSAVAAELGGPAPRTPVAPEGPTETFQFELSDEPVQPVRRLRPEDLVAFLLDPFDAWLTALHGPPRRSPPPLQAALDLDVGRQRHLLERMLAEIWPDESPRAFALDQLAPADLPPPSLAEPSRARLVDTLAAWQDHLHAEGLPMSRIERRATPNLDFEAWELGSSSVWVVDDGPYCRITAAPGRANLGRARAEAFVHHALANTETERSTLHLAVDEDGARRFELRPWSTREAKQWLAGLGGALVAEAHDLHLPLDSAWALWEARDRPEAERRRAWSRLRLRADPRSGLRVPSLEEAEARIERSFGEVARRCL